MKVILSMYYNILCLHGCNMTLETFQSCFSNMLHICKNDTNMKFFFMEAKYDHPLGGKTWYHKPLNVTDIGHELYDENLVSDTIHDLDQFIIDNKINILLGFSQGGNVVDVYLKYFNTQKLIKQAVIMSSYSLVNNNEPIIDDTTSVLCVISDEDTIVASNLYPKNYTNALLLKHNKGHKIPGNPVLRQIKNFILTNKL